MLTDAAAHRLTEELAEGREMIATAERERDEARHEAEQLCYLVAAIHAALTSDQAEPTLDAARRVASERDEAGKQLERMRGYMLRIWDACGKTPEDGYTPWEAVEALRERVKLAEAWLAAWDALPDGDCSGASLMQWSRMDNAAREAFRSSAKGGEP